jgi:hypothetical protein
MLEAVQAAQVVEKHTAAERKESDVRDSAQKAALSF